MNNNEQKIIKMELFKALGILASAILVSGVSGAFIAYNTLNTDHFTLASTVSKLEVIAQQVNKDESYIPQFITAQSDINNLKTNIAELKTLTKDNNDKLNMILGRLGNR